MGFRTDRSGVDLVGLLCFLGRKLRIIIETLNTGNLEDEQSVETLRKDVRHAVADLPVDECVCTIESEHREHVGDGVHTPRR